jgi:hypothetical protein
VSIGHKDPALYTARQLITDVCECGETEGEHEGQHQEGPCGASGCVCTKFKRADLVVSRPARKGKRS